MNRLFEILLILLEKEKITTKQLAENFEVSRRTILRDIDKLLVAGIPIVTHLGYKGGITIDESYQLDFKLVSKEERESILYGLQAIDSVSSSPKLPNFINRLLGQKDILSYNEVMDIDLSSWYGETLIPKIEMIKESIINHTKLNFLYVSPKGESNKIVSPIKIMFKWSAWYVLGICEKANEPRYYKLNRIDKLEKTNQTFKEYNVEYPSDAYFEKTEYELVAIFDSKVKYRLVDEYGVNCCIEKDGTLLFKEGFVNKEYMISWLLSFGADVQVLEPIEIREEIINVIRNMNKNYEYDI